MNSSNSFKTVINLLRLQFKVYSDESFSAKNIKRKLGYLIPIAVCVLAMVGLMLYSLIKIARYFVDVQMPFEFLQILFLLVQAVQFVLGISMVTNILFGSENEDLLKLPVTGTEIFLSKIFYLYIHELIFSMAIVLPSLLLFGIVFKQSVVFFLMIIPVCLLFPIFPFTLALLTSIPTMYLRKKLKNKFLVLLIGAIISISISYVVYMLALEFVLKLVFFNTTRITFTPALISSIVGLSRILIPEMLLCNLLYAQDVFLSVIVMLTASFLVLFTAVIFAKKWYYTAFYNGIENAGNTSRSKSHLPKGGALVQLMNREFVNIFRSVNYSFQYLALAASTPIMVFFCSRLSFDIGTSNVGELIMPGLTVLVVTMFITIASSFSASAVTREGSKLYNMKIIPAPIKLQITAKLAVYSVVAVISIALSCAGLSIAKYVGFKLGLVICVTCILMAIGGICNSIKRDIKNPSFKDLGNGEMVVTNNNTIASISIGILTSLLVGGGVIALCFYSEPDYSLWAMLSAGVVFAAASLLRLFVGLNKAFDRIEP